MAAPPEKPGRNDGFTLVELMVVLAIVGLMAGAVVLALPDPEGSVRAEAVRFAARAKAAQEQAVMNNRPVAIVLTTGGYSVEHRGGGEWRASAEEAGSRRWKTGTQAALEGPEQRILFDSTGYAEAARLRLQRSGEAAIVEIANGGDVHVLP